MSRRSVKLNAVVLVMIAPNEGPEDQPDHDHHHRQHERIGDVPVAAQDRRAQLNARALTTDGLIDRWSSNIPIRHILALRLCPVEGKGGASGAAPSIGPD